MFGLSFTEVLIIAVLALVLLGPDQLPTAARTAGKWMRELRRATDDLKDQFETEMYLDERRSRPNLVPPVPVGQPPQPPVPPAVAAAENVPGLEAAPPAPAPAEPAAASAELAAAPVEPPAPPMPDAPAGGPPPKP